MKNIFYLLLSYILLFSSCEAQQKFKNQFSSEFKHYWYSSEAEITSYELSQARYGELRDGEVILVFVTEDFLNQKQVKKESNTNASSTSVLKLNFIRKFPTGIYSYSMMTSVFTPINVTQFNTAIKTTTSSQEWCGHSWLQFNQVDNGYDYSSYSYFEKEADEKGVLKYDLLEESIWNQIRINPDLIPTGERLIVPSSHFIRFSHQKIAAHKAIISNEPYKLNDFKGTNLKQIKINYPELNRALTIVYESTFPHDIIGWKESRTAFGKKLTTTAKRKSSIKSPYWNKHSNSDDYLRDSLKLR